MQITNKKEIRFVGLQRSGNHAVINWILSQELGKICFLNFVKSKTNPFITATQDRLPRFCKQFNIKNEAIQPTFKHCLFYSYEDEDLAEVFCSDFLINHDSYLGKSQTCFNVLVLRDPFNFFSCRIQWLKGDYKGKIPLNSQENIAKLIDLWKMYAKEYLCQTSYLSPNKVVINFNKWFLDKNYRIELAKILLLKFTDAGIDECAVMSTFEDKKDGDFGARNLKVLDRWQGFVNDPIFKSVIRDRELLELSDRIFGKIFPWL